MINSGYDQPSPIKPTDSIPEKQVDQPKDTESKPALDKEKIGLLLKEWQTANDNYFLYYSHEIKTATDIIDYSEEYWDDQAFSLSQELSYLTVPRSFPYEKKSSIDFLNTKGNQILNRLAQDPNFNEKGVLADYIASTIWLTKQPMEIGSVLTDEEVLEKVEEVKNLLYPPLQEITINLLHEKDNHSIEKYMERLSSAGQADFAENIITDSRLSIQEKTNFIVNFMNNFGIMSGINLLSSKTDKHPDIKKVYALVQGEDITKVYQDLQSLYSEINFDEYFINTPEFTEKELDLIKQEVNNHCQRQYGNPSPKSITILDIGAGTGRHTIPLFRDGYQITALELQDNHVKTIKHKESKLSVIQQNWLDLKLEQKINFAYCLERSALHNQTAADMLKFFDNISSALEEDGTLLIDFADTSTGEYQSKVDKFKQNLKSLGVQDSKIQYIFDGVDKEHQFNRMAPNKEQIEVYAKLTGFKIIRSYTDTIGEISNTYYVFTKDPDFYPNDYSRQDLSELLTIIGLYGKDTDYNQFIKNWEMSIGQALILGLDDESVRRANNKGKISRVSVIKKGKNISLQTTLPY